MSKLAIVVIVIMSIFTIGSFYGINKIINNRMQVIQTPKSSMKTIEAVTKAMGETHLNVENRINVNVQSLQNKD